MSSPDRQREFEAQLLASARDDRSPVPASTAWDRFERDLQAAALATGDHAADVREAARPHRSETASVPKASRARWAWLLGGFALGGVVTAFVLSQLPGRAPHASTIVHVTPPLDGAHPPQRLEASAPGADVQGIDPGRAIQDWAAQDWAAQDWAAQDWEGQHHDNRSERVQTTGLENADRRTMMPHAPARAARGRSSAAPARPSPQVPSAPKSGLAAQVAMLDQARGALAIGRVGRVTELVRRFHQRFPDSPLAPDAEVLALEALAAQGARLQLAQRAAAFLDVYPYDPHTARVRALLADE